MCLHEMPAFSPNGVRQGCISKACSPQRGTSPSRSNLDRLWGLERNCPRGLPGTTNPLVVSTSPLVTERALDGQEHPRRHRREETEQARNARFTNGWRGAPRLQKEQCCPSHQSHPPNVTTPSAAPRPSSSHLPCRHPHPGASR